MIRLTEAQSIIDISLRFIFFGLECALGVEFDVKQVEKVFTDEINDQCSAKEYVFFKKDKLAVTGDVDEYEPELIYLHVHSAILDQSRLNSILERAKYQAMRLQKAQNRLT